MESDDDDSSTYFETSEESTLAAFESDDNDDSSTCSEIQEKRKRKSSAFADALAVLCCMLSRKSKNPKYSTYLLSVSYLAIRFLVRFQRESKDSLDFL